MPKYKLIQVAEFPALGGHASGDITAEMKADGYGPTTTGVFTVDKIEPHRSFGRWTTSAVVWNSETKIINRNVVMVNMGGRWQKLSSLDGWKPKTENQVFEDLQKYYDEFFNSGSVGFSKRMLNLDRKGLLATMGVKYIVGSPVGREIPAKWLLNDFGHKSIKFFRDKNHDGRRNKRERSNPQFLHSSPNTEVWFDMGPVAQMTVLAKAKYRMSKMRTLDFMKLFNKKLLGYSHGCIHVFPNHIDTMLKKGYLKKRSIVQVHPYKKKATTTLTVNRRRTLNFEVHFFPFDPKVVVYKTSRLVSS